jgi:hypothetical protein
VSSRRAWWAGLLLISACGPKIADDGCSGGEAAAKLSVDVPAGMSSLSSFQASGACSAATGEACVATSASCDGGGCACAFELEVVATPGTATIFTCHIEATSITGRVVSRDVPFTVEQGGPCPALVTTTPEVTLSFDDAGASDAGADGDRRD